MDLTTDYHMHTTFSDGRSSMVDMCRRAVSLGLREIAFTEHAEWQNGQTGFSRVEAYFEELNACRRRFQPLGLWVYSGVELGNPHQYPAETAALLARYPFDIKIAALHWLDGLNIHEPACFKSRSGAAVYDAYFVELARMVRGLPSDITFVAHFDRILWRGMLLGRPIDVGAHEAGVRAALTAVAERGLALELNTRLLREVPQWHEALIVMLTWFREAGGTRIEVNSDAHHVSHVAANWGMAQQILHRSGFTYRSPAVSAPAFGL